MDLSVTHMFVWNQQFLGIMKNAIVKDFNDIKFKIDFYKFLTEDRQLIETVKKNCEDDHTNVDTLKLISTDNVYSKLLNYNEAEEFIKNLRFILGRNIYEDMNKKQLWIIDFKFSRDVNFFKVTMNSQQVLRLYNQVNSFYSNYLILSSLMRQNIILSEQDQINKQDKRVTEYIPPSSSKEAQAPPTPQIINDRNDLDNIFELCLTNSIKSSLIHYTFNYFRYITNKHCKILTNDKGQIQYNLPLLMPGKFNINEQYFNSLILSNTSIEQNKIIYIIKKILHNLCTTTEKYKDNPLQVMMVNYLLFVYLLRYLYDSNRESYRHYFSHFICNPTIQNQLLTKIISTGFADFANKIFFKITNIDLNDIDDEYNLEKINKLSEDFKYLIPISQEEFANNVFTETTKNKDKKEQLEIKLSSKKVIDINNLISNNQKQIKSTKSILFDPDNILDPTQEVSNDYNFLDYNLLSSNGAKIISAAYQKILDYIKNPSSILLMKEHEIPKEVKSLFGVISKNILDYSVITKYTISTYDYYKILLEKLPHPQNFKHITFLYIIFQIIIPYHYDVYGNSQFEDYFL